jgi:hypothetical protein
MQPIVYYLAPKYHRERYFLTNREKYDLIQLWMSVIAHTFF